MSLEVAPPASGVLGGVEVEGHSIDFIPASERHGKPSRLFFIWWSSNMQMTTVLTGVIAAALGLTFPWAVVSIIVGLALGGVVMCLHMVQGPRLGIPQILQSRAQFGFTGTVIPAAVAIFMYVGFFATSNLLGGQGITATLPGVPLSVGIIICAAVTAALAIFGYKEIHRWARIWGYGFLIAFFALTISLFTRGKVPSSVWTFGKFDGGPFLLMLSIAAVWVISYAVYASDYSRYLPAEVPAHKTFWWSYAGGNLASFWLLAFGALLGVILPKSISAMIAVTISLVGPLGVPMMFIIALGVIFTDTLNVYGATLSLLAMTEQKRRILGIGRPSRIAVILVISAIAAIIGIIGSANFLTNYSNFLSFLFYLIIPWSAVNLVDFYLVQHGHYSTAAFFDADGPYRGVKWYAVTAYMVGFVCEIPFMSTSILTGPVAQRLNGGDLSWIVGLLVAGLLYLGFVRLGLVDRGRRSATAEASV
ncbi:MAG: purine-cytosine permease family protein [Candidatus Dormibacteria bacterium]